MVLYSSYKNTITLLQGIKNALDYLRVEWNNKAAGIVSYGSVGGARAAEHLRGIMGELLIADVRVHQHYHYSQILKMAQNLNQKKYK